MLAVLLPVIIFSLFMPVWVNFVLGSAFFSFVYTCCHQKHITPITVNNLAQKERTGQSVKSNLNINTRHKSFVISGLDNHN